TAMHTLLIYMQWGLPLLTPQPAQGAHPVLAYSTYFGGNQGDSIAAMAVDPAGNVYIVGTTTSTNLPVRNPYQREKKGLRPIPDVFVAKLNPTGSELVYSTYLGGEGTDYGLGIAIDADGNAYVTGYTTSSDFPTTPGAYQAAPIDGDDAF